MKFIKNIISFFKKIFGKIDDVKMIETPVETIKEEKANFVNSLKVNVMKSHKKKNVETLTCYGDGLGIQTKITY